MLEKIYLQKVELPSIYLLRLLVAMKLEVKLAHLYQIHYKFLPLIGKYRKYKQLVNRSKFKLMNSALHDEQFESKTRSQRRKLGLLKDKDRIPPVGYKLIDVCLLKKMLEKCCICKYCKKKSLRKNKN